MSFAAGLTEPLRSARAVEVLERAVVGNRLGHALLLHGPTAETLAELANALAADLLVTTPHRVHRHPDCFTVRPSKKMRIINVEDMRELVRNIALAPNQAGRKVGIIFDADRFRRESANVFLKTLEEPPSDSTLILLTTRPYDLLPTIRSRCLSFRVPGVPRPPASEGWQGWENDFSEWVRQARSAASPDSLVMPMYGLQQRLEGLIVEETQEALDAEPVEDEELLDEDERAARESGESRAVRRQAYQRMAEAAFAAIIGRDENEAVEEEVFATRVAHAWRVLRRIEEAMVLSEVYNLQLTAALERAFLGMVEILGEC